MLILLAALQVSAPTLKLSEIELPVTDCPLQIITGVYEFLSVSHGLYVDSYQRYWDDTGKAPINYENARVGNCFLKVNHGLFGSISCKVIEVRATRNQKVTRNGQDFKYTHRALRRWYVDSEDKLVADTYELETSFGKWTMEAIFTDEGYTVKLNSPDRGARTMGPINTAFDIAELRTAPFTPMLNEKGEVTVKEKKFKLLDPFVGSPVDAKVLWRSDFVGDFHNNTVKGNRFVFTAGSSKNESFISKERKLVRVEMDKYLFLEADN